MEIKNAIISVYDKTGLIDLVKELEKLGVNIYSTGGTAKLLKENNIKVKEISEYTGFPEILDGRVKTLHPKIHGGILAIRDKEEHKKQLKDLGIQEIDLVIVNLYPFEKTVSSLDIPEEVAIENIDIGGVTLIRAAAKNFKYVLVVVDPKDYNVLIEKVRNGSIDIDFRRYLAMKAFLHTARYDSIISNWFKERNKEKFPEEYVVGMKKLALLRYGENPHQESALYRLHKFTLQPTLVDAEIIQGKQLSYNNYLDLDSAYNLVKNFDRPACVIIKHNNPCGVAVANNVLEAYRKALVCDPVSAFGGIIGFNYEVDKETAEEIVKLFTECIIAPEYTEEALKIFSEKQDLRLLKLPVIKFEPGFELKQIDGGILLQDKDILLGLENLQVVTNRQPTKEELESLKFAWVVAKYVKSNAIVLAKGTQTVGIGAGQMSRIDSLKIAKIKMDQISEEEMRKIDELPLVLASDAFFPFRDVVDEAAKIGVKAIIQPGGSLRDKDSIQAANEHGIAMVFTGIRHFRH